VLWFPSPSQKKAAGRLPSSLLERVKRSLKSNKRRTILAQLQRIFQLPRGRTITSQFGAAIRSLFQTIMATFNSDLTLHSQNLEKSGDLAYDSGDFQETLTTIGTGAKIISKGSYIIIFKRQANGSWQIVQHVWTGTPPAGA
jgi:hypothetical protein